MYLRTLAIAVGLNMDGAVNAAYPCCQVDFFSNFPAEFEGTRGDTGESLVRTSRSNPMVCAKPPTTSYSLAPLRGARFCNVAVTQDRRHATQWFAFVFSGGSLGLTQIRYTCLAPSGVSRKN